MEKAWWLLKKIKIEPSYGPAIPLVGIYVCMLSHFSCAWLFATPMTIACKALLSIGLSWQEYWGGLPFPPPGDLSDPGIEPVSPALAGGFFNTEPSGKLSMTWTNLFHSNYMAYGEYYTCFISKNWGIQRWRDFFVQMSWSKIWEKGIWTQSIWLWDLIYLYSI